VTIDLLSRSARVLVALAAVALTAQSPAPRAAGGAPWCTAIPLPGACQPLDLAAPHAHLRLAVVATEPLREQGLMHVTSVPANEGMLFAFADGDKEREFWMKNTITSLDMIWVKANGVVSVVTPNVPATAPGTPDDKVARRAGVGTYVIELGAGAAARSGIAPGVKLVIPRVEAQ
jgi:uncharacterized membrane protein (UPF0127 family)